MKPSAAAYRVVDVLVIGSGLAGCSAALAAAQRELNVVLITSASDIEGCSSYQAQGGIMYRAPDDNIQSFIDDFQQAGAGIVNEKAIHQIYRYGSQLLQEILVDQIGVPFDRDTTGELSLTQEAAHSKKRIAHVKDHTGKFIQERMFQRVRETENIELITAATAVDLITLAHHSLNYAHVYEPSTCSGAYILFQETGEVRPVLAKQTILATGGLGRIYLHTTNPEKARGDGYVMVYRAGGRIMNMEYTQFHPTTLFSPDGERFLITEALRGEGGILRNRAGQAFMDDFHALGSLAPRDIVSRGIIQEMNRTESSYVYLDVTHKDAAWIRERFPTVYQKCMEINIDLTREPIPVVPAAHYECGGVAVDGLGNTSIRRLKAVGEVACTGLHGANRLASSSLLECLVCGTLAGQNCAELIRTEKAVIPQVEQWQAETEPVDPDLLREDLLIIKHTMWNYVGIIRTHKKLERAFGIFQKLCYDIEQFYAHSQLSDELIGLRNAATASTLVLHAARLNRKSRGCHYRID